MPTTFAIVVTDNEGDVLGVVRVAGQAAAMRAKKRIEAASPDVHVREPFAFVVEDVESFIDALTDTDKEN